MKFKKKHENDLEGFSSTQILSYKPTTHTVSVSGSVKFTPKEDKKGYADEVDYIVSTVNNYVKDHVIEKNGLSDRYIFDVKVSRDSVRYGRPTQFKYSFFFNMRVHAGIDPLMEMSDAIIADINHQVYDAIVSQGFDIVLKDTPIAATN